jgi:hypothetical protein
MCRNFVQRWQAANNISLLQHDETRLISQFCATETNVADALTSWHVIRVPDNDGGVQRKKIALRAKCFKLAWNS